MTPIRVAPRRRSRFRYEQIVQRVERAREEKAISTKALAEQVGITGSAWYRKLRDNGSRFTLDEFGAIAEALDAPEGWPFVEWE